MGKALCALYNIHRYNPNNLNRLRPGSKSISHGGAIFSVSYGIKIADISLFKLTNGSTLIIYIFE